MKNQRLSHLLIANPTELISFTSISSGGSRKRIPLRDRDLHSKFLRERIRVMSLDCLDGIMRRRMAPRCGKTVRLSN